MANYLRLLGGCVCALLISTTAMAQGVFKSAAITVALPGATSSLKGIQWPSGPKGEDSVMGLLAQGPVTVKWADGKESKFNIRGQFSANQNGGIITRVTLYLSYDNLDFKVALGQLQKAVAALPFATTDALKADLAKWQAFTAADVKAQENSLRTRMTVDGFHVELELGLQTNPKKQKVWAPQIAMQAGPEALAGLSKAGTDLPLLKQKGTAFAASFSADGKLLATTAGQGINVWDLASRQITTNLQLPGFPRVLVLSADGTRVAVAYEGKPAETWDLVTQKVIASVPVGAQDYPRCISPDLKYLVVAANADARVLDMGTGKELVKLVGKSNGSPRGAAISPDSKRLAIAEQHQRVVRLYDLPSGALVKEFAPKSDAGGLFRNVAFSPDGKTIVVAAMTGLFAFDVDGATQEKLWLITDVGYALAFMPDSRHVVCGTWRATGLEHVNIVDLAAKKVTGNFGPFKECVQAVATDPKGRFVSVVRDGATDVVLLEPAAKK